MVVLTRSRRAPQERRDQHEAEAAWIAPTATSAVKELREVREMPEVGRTCELVLETPTPVSDCLGPCGSRSGYCWWVFSSCSGLSPRSRTGLHRAPITVHRYLQLADVLPDVPARLDL